MPDEVYEGWLFPPEDSKGEDVILDFNYEDYKLSVLWGSVSSGKTVDSSIAWAGLVKRAPKQYPLAMIGKTELTLEANVIDPLTDFLGSDTCYKKGNVAWIYGHKVRLYGANDAKSRSKIQGKSLYAWYGDEVTTWPEDFFMMALSRLRVGKAKAILTMNPEGPYHWFHKQIIERADQPEIRAKLYHFTMDDNPFLPDDYKAWISSMYVPGTVWYKRWILGEWATAEGAIYPDYQSAVVPAKDLPVAFDSYLVTCDYGTTNPFVYLMLGRAGGVWYVIKEFYHDSKKSGIRVNAQQSQELRTFLNGILPRNVEVDPSAAAFIAQLRQDYPDLSDRGVIIPAINTVLTGIQQTAQKMYQGTLKIADSCSKTIEEMANYAWDPKTTERGEDAPAKVNDHAMDCLRYAVNRITWDGL